MSYNCFETVLNNVHFHAFPTCLGAFAVVIVLECFIYSRWWQFSSLISSQRTTNISQSRQEFMQIQQLLHTFALSLI